MAAALRFAALDRYPLWIDEANSVLIAGRGLGGVWSALAEDGNPPLFYWLLGLWMGLFGSSEAAVRALPALLGVLCVAATWWAARRLHPQGRWTPLAAGALLALAPLAVDHARLCRMYALTPLLAVLAAAALHRALTTRRAGWLSLHALLLAAGLWTHNYFLFALPAGPVAAWIAPGRHGRARAVALASAAALAAVLAYLPWLPVLIGQAGSGVAAWIEPWWRSTPPAAAPLRSLELMGPGGAFPAYLSQLARPERAIALPGLWPAARGLGAALVALLLGASLLARAADPPQRLARALCWALLALPLALPVAASFAWRPIYLPGRYEALALPAFAILAARGLEALGARAPRLARAAAALWVALSGLALAAYFAAPAPQDERAKARWIAENARPGDVFVFPGYARAVPEYYLRRMGFAGRRVSFPAAVERHMGWFDAGAAVRDAAGTRAEARRLAAELAGAVAAGGRVLLLDVDPAARRAGLTDLLRGEFRSRLGGEQSLAGASGDPVVFVYAGG